MTQVTYAVMQRKSFGNTQCPITRSLERVGEWTVGRFVESTDDACVGGGVTVIAPKVAGLVA